jgi:hypothetical protein
LMSRGSTEYDIIGGTAASKFAVRELVNTTVDDGVTALQVNGYITATTPTAGANNTQVATTAFVSSAISASSSGVTSFNTRTGAVTLTASDVTGVGGALLASPTFTGAPTAPTPAEFDVSANIATTSYVNSAGLHYPNTAGIGWTTSTTITLSQLNQWGQFQATGLTQTLPAGATVTTGSTMTFLGGGIGGTIKANASELITGPTSVSANTYTVAIGETVTLAYNSVSNGGWYVVSDGMGSLSINSAVSTAVQAAKYYDVTGGASGAITATQIMTLYVAARTLNFPANFAGSQGYAVVAPTSSNTFTVAVNNTPVGTIVFAAGSHTATFTTSSGAFTVTPGQYITVTAPATADATLATVAFTLLSLAS